MRLISHKKAINTFSFFHFLFILYLISYIPNLGIRLSKKRKQKDDLQIRGKVEWPIYKNFILDFLALSTPGFN
jgi:hypothetical protein